MKNEYKQVLLLLNYYYPRLHRGIADFSRKHNWILEVAEPKDYRPAIEGWRGDGVILDHEDGVEQFHERGIKIAASTLSEKIKHFADCVESIDDQHLAETAVNYFLQKGFENFAGYAAPHRRKPFAEELAKRGISMVEIPEIPLVRSISQLSHLSGMLLGLKKPCAVFCESDPYSTRLFQLAMSVGLRVPEDLSILGVGNDDLLCNSAGVPLSSIDTQLYRRGYRLAEKLDQAMNGLPANSIPSLTATVIERQSTALYAVSDPGLQDMLNYLNRHAANPLKIADFARRFYRSESAVYRLFVKNFGISPKRMLLNIRMEQACRKLMETEDKISTIALECGFPTPSAFFDTFRVVRGTTPEEWRKNNR